MNNRLFRLSTEQHGICFYCKREVMESHKSVDHVYPRRAGRVAETEWQNTVMACTFCNQQKGGRLPTDDELYRLLLLKRSVQESDEMDDVMVWLTV